MSLCFNPGCIHQNPDGERFCQQCGNPLLLGDRYRALREIGSGGFSKTYLGADEWQLDKPQCAIKQFLPNITNNRDISSRLFRKEAERLRSLSHPQIPKFLGYFEWEGQQYIVQEFVPGQTLAQELAISGPFTETKIRDLLRQLLPILQYLHAHRLIHRDIKPSNIIRRASDRRLVLVDFGATKLATGTALAKTGTSIGTVEFVAPEQLRGKAVFASDLYSLGVTCIHLLADTSPFDLVDGDNHWVWRDWTKTNPVSRQLGTVLDRLIDPAIGDRYTSASQALGDLNAPILLRKPPTILQQAFAGAISILLLIVSLEKIGLIPAYQPPTSPLPANQPQVPPTSSTPTNQPLGREINLDLMEAWFAQIGIQHNYYLEHGKFLVSPSQLIPMPSHYFAVQPIENGIQVAAIPRQRDTYGYVAVLWGGKISETDRQRQANWKPRDPTDFGMLSMPNLSKNPSDYATRITYCESLQAVMETPPISRAPLRLPLFSYELPCPNGYAFSFGIIEAIGKLSAKMTPTKVVPIASD